MSIVHVEDDPLWADVVSTVARKSPSLNYIGRAETLQTGLTLVQSSQPDLVVLDLRLPDSHTFDLVDRFESIRPTLRILVLSAVINDAVLVSLNRPCVRGMVWKSTLIPQTLPGIFCAISQGGIYFPPEVRDAISNVRSRPDAFFKILSKKELELLPLLGRGDTNAEIAQSTGLQPSTVKSHRDHLMAKLGLHSSEKLMRWAAEKGFVNFEARSRLS